MRLPSILLVIGTILVLVAQKEVQARNYLLRALGLEEESHDRRRLSRGNLKARARIAEHREQKREQRKESRTVDVANASPVEAADPVGTKRFDDEKQAASDTISIAQVEDSQPIETEVGNKKAKPLSSNIRYKVAKAVNDQATDYAQIKVATNTKSNGKRANNHGQAIAATDNIVRSQKRNKNARPTEIGAERKKKVERVKAKIDKKRGKDIIEKEELHEQVEGREQEDLAGDPAGITKHGRHKTRAGERHHRNEKKKRGIWNEEKRTLEHEAKKDAAAIDVTKGAGESAGDINARTGADVDAEAEPQEAAGGGTQRHHKQRADRRVEKNQEKRRDAKNQNKRNLKKKRGRAVVDEAPQKRTEHHLGFKKREHERISREKAGLARKKRGHKDTASAEIEHVTLRDGGLGDEAMSLGTLSLDNDGVTTPVVSLYWGIFNNPDACPQQPCKLEDAIDPYTKASLLHGTTGFPDAFGKVTLVTSIYRTPEYVDFSGPALLDGLALKTGGAFPSAGFYNNEAEVVIGIRKSVSAEGDTLSTVLESMEFSDSLDFSSEFSQFVTFKAGQTGFEAVYSVANGEVVQGANAHLTRQNDAMQIYVETNVNEYNIS